MIAGRWLSPPLVAAALTCLTSRLTLARVQHSPGHAAPADEQAGAGICRLLSAQPVVVPTLSDAGALRTEASPYLRLADDARRRELTIQVGPVDLPAHGMAQHSRALVYQLTHVPFDLWVHGFRLELRDERGRPVPQRVLHHIDTTRPLVRDVFLPVAQRFVALGHETAPEHLPGWLAGVRLYSGEPLLVSTMLHNSSDTAYAGVRVRIVLSYTRSRPLVEVAGFRLDVMFPTGPMEFDLPPGRTIRSWEGSPRVPVRIIGITGHLHRYAEWMELRDVTTDQSSGEHSLARTSGATS